MNDEGCTCKMIGCSFGCMKQQRDAALARVEELEELEADKARARALQAESCGAAQRSGLRWKDRTPTKEEREIWRSDVRRARELILLNFVERLESERDAALVRAKELELAPERRAEKPPARPCASCGGKGVVTSPDLAGLKDGPAFDAADFVEKVGAVYHCFRCNGTGVEPEGAKAPPEELLGLAALVCGYNELAKQAGTLGERLFFRLMRQKAEEALVARGGEKVVAEVGTVMTLPSRPEVPLYEQDVEAMRVLLAEREKEIP
jgi:hypothetical protein